MREIGAATDSRESSPLLPASFGPYTALSELGRGGGGVVYRAQHASGRRVALKVLLPELSESRQAVARFFHEARSLARVNDPGIAEVFDAGYASDGSAFIAMELLEGESLSSRLRRERASLALLVHVGCEVARIVGAAHAVHIIHRDLKPDNVFLVTKPHAPLGVAVKVLDFGMAKLNPDEGPYSFVTDEGALLGTPLYMAPEQCRGGEIDARTDVYALGCMLYELACGRPPFVEGGVGLILGAHVYAPVPPPRSLASTIPPALEALLLRALAKEPAHRHPSMADLARELAAVE